MVKKQRKNIDEEAARRSTDELLGTILRNPDGSIAFDGRRLKKGQAGDDPWPPRLH